MDILWRDFHILTEPVPYTFAYVNRQNNETRSNIVMWVQTYTEPVPLKYKSRHKYPCIYGFFTV